MRLLPVLFLLTGCVGYREARVDLSETARNLDAEKPGFLGYREALALARERNPGLRSLRAEARAAGLDAPPWEAELSYEPEMVDLMVDPLGLARVGPRGAAFRVAEARRIEALAALDAAERGLAADLLLVYLVERVLASRGAPEPPLDPGPYEKSGLATPNAVASLRAARRAAEAEAVAIAAERAANLAAFRRLLGVGARAEAGMRPLDAELPPSPVTDPGRIPLRADLLSSLARYGSVDAELRLAVSEQWPRLRIGGRVEISGSGLGGLVAVVLPVGAHRRAQAALARREAAREELLGAVALAGEDAERARLSLEAAEASAGAKASAASAMGAEYRAAVARLEVEPGDFPMAADLALRAVAEAREAREAAVEAARARVGCLRAFAWPTREEMP